MLLYAMSFSFRMVLQPVWGPRFAPCVGTDTWALSDTAVRGAGHAVRLSSEASGLLT
jgi:hypothetical protein